MAENLSLKGSIPDVQAQMGLLADLQHDEKLAAMTVGQLSEVGTKLRHLVSLVDQEERGVLFTDFKDQLTGSDTQFFTDLGSSVNVAQYRKKMVWVSCVTGNPHGHSQDQGGASPHRR